MPDVVRHVLEAADGFKSAEAASFIAQMDDLSRRLRADTRDLTPQMLGWQPAPGMNTMGMLLAHNAIVEVFWTGLVLDDLQRDAVPYVSILGVSGDDDGMPMPEAGLPPAAIANKDIAFFDDLLDRARANLKRAARTLDDAAMERQVTRTRPDGTARVVNVRWTIYHMLEHFSGHYGQVLLLKHLYRSRKG
jgi:DinB superfamily